jgi:hypothetical protein
VSSARRRLSAIASLFFATLPRKGSFYYMETVLGSQTGRQGLLPRLLPITTS